MRCFNECAHLRKVGLRTPEEAFRSEARIAAQWRELGWRGAPDLGAAIREYDGFVTAIAGCGAEPVFLPGADDLTLDAIYVRDSAIATKQGVMLCRRAGASRASRAGASRPPASPSPARSRTPACWRAATSSGWTTRPAWSA